MEEILKKLMNINCISMHDSNYRCYGKGCNGQCAQFQVALQALGEHECKRFLNKACEYLESALKHDLGYYGAIDFANTFRKTMEE